VGLKTAKRTSGTKRGTLLRIRTRTRKKTSKKKVTNKNAKGKKRRDSGGLRTAKQRSERGVPLKKRLGRKRGELTKNSEGG